MDALVCRYHFDDGSKTCVAFKGRKFIQMITINPDISIRKLPVSEYDLLTPIDYPLGKASDKMLEIGERNGITQAAKTLLKSIPAEEEIDMELNIEKPSEQEVQQSYQVTDTPDRPAEDVCINNQQPVGELSAAGLTAKQISLMLDSNAITKQQAVDYLQKRVDERTSKGKTVRKPTLNLLKKLQE